MNYSMNICVEIHRVVINAEPLRFIISLELSWEQVMILKLTAVTTVLLDIDEMAHIVNRLAGAWRADTDGCWVVSAIVAVEVVDASSRVLPSSWMFGGAV